MTAFSELNLNSDIMKSLDDLGFVEPTPIQEQAIPFILESKEDLTALAQTGTGKTAAFGLPILNQIKSGERDLQSIILCPTRELCLQISSDMKKFAKHSRGLSITPVYGGERIDIQIRALKKGTNVVVGTPGRVCDLIRRGILKLGNVKWLVLDEADEMLDMGFKDDLDTILDQTPETRQTLLFSATMSKSVASIARKYMKNTHEISTGEKNIGADNVSHEYYMVHARDRFEALKRILDSFPGIYGILFCRTRRETQEVADKLKKMKYSAEAMHGDISQNMRTKIMSRFRDKQIHLLVATDVAARGIDVSDLTHVINYNLPDQDETYTHRSGRTGRANKSGVSVSIINMRETRRIRRMEDIVGKKFEKKKVPTGEGVFQKQIESLISKIADSEDIETKNKKSYDEIVEKLESIDKDDLINYLVADKFSHIIDNYANARDLNTSGGGHGRDGHEKENHVNLKINFGKKSGLDVKGLFGLINSCKSLQGLVIGRIDLFSEHSIFSVDKKASSNVVKELNKTKHRNIPVRVSISDIPVDYSTSPNRRSSGGRGRSGGGGYRGKRSGGGGGRSHRGGGYRGKRK